MFRIKKKAHSQEKRIYIKNKIKTGKLLENIEW